MCGIVGVVGSNNARNILIKGLQELEYRGYDSAGIFLTDTKQKEYLIKAVGRIANLQEKIGEEVNGSTGIGHTRWATHGKPTENNAHPHTSQTGRFILVHNGVIENYRELKEEYLADHHFMGQTDTEICVHLIEKFAEDGNISTKEALQKSLAIIKGSFAFALIDKNNTNTIYIAKNKSPLLVGLAENYNVIASDAIAIIRETKKFTEIYDGEMAIVTKDSLSIFDQNDNEIKREPYIAQLDPLDVDKGIYSHYMLKEIEEQPAVIRKIMQKYIEDGKYLVSQAIINMVEQADRVYIVAAGTSYHAGLASKTLFEQLTQRPVEVHIASEFGYNTPLLSAKPLFIYMSQSGETADSRQVLVKTKALGYPSLTITNVPSSTLSREANHTLLIHAGPEIAVASTKAYTAQIAVMAILAKAVGDSIGNVLAEEFKLSYELSVVATSMTAVLETKNSIEQKAVKQLNAAKSAFYIGRGQDYYVAMEAALKLKEISYIQCEGFAAGELKHGTIALIEAGTPVQAIISNKSVGVHTRGNIMEVESRGAIVLTISSASCANDKDDIIVPDVHHYLTSIAMVVPTQLIAYFATLQRGLDVDKPRNLAKSVTVE